ncbi:MAG: hypothetical protein PHY08_13115 [Candidatus Cloacimonetes bacterium]|nr:hypothetical protein [Candidatus Cloacimonadota bacterium]
MLTHVRKHYQCDGLAEVYVQALKRGYKRSYGSMVKQISKINRESASLQKQLRRNVYTKHEEVRGKYPGDKVQIDIKYVPEECVKFKGNGNKYYQITAIDECSRKRVLTIVDDKSTYQTSKFLITLEKEIGFKINTVQTFNVLVGRNIQKDFDMQQQVPVFVPLLVVFSLQVNIIQKVKLKINSTRCIEN